MTIPDLQQLAEQYRRGARFIVISERGVQLWTGRRRAIEHFMGQSAHIIFSIRSLVGALYVKPTKPTHKP